MKKIFLLFIICLEIFGLDLKKINSFQSDFEQTISNSKKTISYKGSVFLKEPANVLWKYNKPQKKVYIINDTIIVEEKALEQVMFSKLENEINILKIIDNAKEVSDNKFVTKIKNIEYTILVKNENIDSIVYKDELENAVTIKFKNGKINSQISDDTFKYEVPSGFDVVKK